MLAGRAAEAAKTGAKHKSCILLFMDGGPAQSHTFDVKPGGQYKTIQTSVPGIEISEHLPKVAQHMEHMAILRSMATGDANHGTAHYLMHTGYRQGLGGVVYPSLGAIVSNEIADPDFELPNYVAVGSGGFFGGNYLGPGYLGPRHSPVILTDFSKGIENVKPFRGFGELDEQASLLQELDQKFFGQYQATAIEAHQKGYERALALMRSPKGKAFDLDQEPASVRQAYGIGRQATPTGNPAIAGLGPNRFAEGCLLARRLVEAGVPFVEVSLSGWDTHGGAAQPVRNLSGTLDPAMATLISDLKERGLLDSTLVIWMGEFGRTPGNGDNHFARAWSTVLAGAGLKTGQVIGRTDAKGATVEERPISVIDFMATVCQALGIDYNKRVREGGSGRPHRIVENGANPIVQLFG
ncbi:hypothetical protein AYO44_18090 [Planctomycetaceae bacterium SCGC AG-212-F19]|nr:hypothetical protein AYO44_18090 [Planctomycetaceae bacterium SCGC AG-212-F19]